MLIGVSFLMLIGIILLAGCLFWGAPDSSIVNIVGKNIKNFIDTTNQQREEINLEKDYLILYRQEDYSRDKGYLYLKDTENNKTLRIFEGHVGYEIKYGLIIPEKKIIVFSFSDERIEPFGRTLLKVYDYLNNTYTDEKEIIDGESEHERFILSELVISKDKQYIAVEMFKSLASRKYTYTFKCFRLKGNLLIPSTEITYKEIKKEQREDDVQIGSKYITQNGERLMVFRVSQESDFLPANYKPKYNGLYIYSKKDNINRRISLRNEFYVGPILWIDSGSKLTRGGYLYDTTGRKKESLLVEGTIIYIIEKKK